MLAAAFARAASDESAIVRRLGDPSDQVRREAARLVLLGGSEMAGLVPALLARLPAEPSSDVRDMIIRALGAAGRGQPEVPPVLASVLRDESSPGLRLVAVSSLASLGPQAAAAVPALVQALHDESTPVRAAAAAALGRFGDQADVVVPALAAALDDGATTDAALRALVQLQWRALPTLTRVRRLVADPATPGALRRRAIAVLGAIGPAARTAATDCEPWLRDPDPWTRLAAATAVLSLRGDGSAAARTLTELLPLRDTRPDPDDVWQAQQIAGMAAVALTEHGALADGTALTTLARNAEDPSPAVYRPAAIAFDRVLSALVQAHRFEAIDSLAQARDTLDRSDSDTLRTRGRRIAEAVAELEQTQPLTVRLQRHAMAAAATAAAMLTLAGGLLHRLRRRSPRVFLSYRRSDSAAWCGRLYDRLEAELGAGRTFRDIDSLEPGDRFEQRLRERIGASDAFVAVIGPGWLAAADESGRRRIDDPEDFVRQEIETALAAGKPLFPVLVDGARMPTAAELPPSIAALVSANAITVTDTHLAADVAKLVKSIRASARR